MEMGIAVGLRGVALVADGGTASVLNPPTVLRISALYPSLLLSASSHLPPKQHWLFLSFSPRHLFRVFG